MSDPSVNDAVQSLSRIVQASARLIGETTALGRVVDREEEVAHIKANLDHVQKILKEARP